MAKTIKQILEMVAEASFDKSRMAARRKERRKNSRLNKKMRKMVDTMKAQDAENEFKARGKDFLVKHGGVKEDVHEASLKDIKSPTAAKKEIAAAKKEMARMDKLGRLLPHEASKYRQLARKVKVASGWLKEGASPEADHQQNKRHHGNTTMELESAPTKVAKMKYRGPIKKVPGSMKEGLAPKQVYSSMLSPDSETAKRTGGLKGKNMTKDKKRLMGMSALRVKGAQIRTEDHSK